MKRVVCIHDKYQHSTPVKVEKGNLYHVIKEYECKEVVRGNVKEPAGVYYELIEIGGWCFHSSLFITINENQQDETEMNYNEEPILTRSFK